MNLRLLFTLQALWLLTHTFSSSYIEILIWLLQFYNYVTIYGLILFLTKCGITLFFLKDFLEKTKSIESVTKVLEQRDCAIALLLGMDLNEGLKRDGVIISKEETKGEEVSFFYIICMYFLVSRCIPHIHTDNLVQTTAIPTCRYIF